MVLFLSGLSLESVLGLGPVRWAERSSEYLKERLAYVNMETM